MSLRLIQVIAPTEKQSKVAEIMREQGVEGVHNLPAEEGKLLLRGILRAEDVEEVLEALDAVLDENASRILITGVEATVPAIAPREENEGKDKEPKTIQVGKFIRISKEELRGDIEHSSELNVNYIFMVVLSSLVAGIGILKGNLAIVIGAMVIAPFLGPNVSLAFGATIGDVDLLRKSIVTGMTGTLIAVAISVLWGAVDPAVNQIQTDNMVEYRDIILALTCGFAGVLSMMTSQATSLVGVMVAAALLPPLIRAGLFMGGQLWRPGLVALVLFMVNVVCVILAGILTFYLSGIRPKNWWEQESAKKHTRRAMIILTVILLLLLAGIFILRHTQID